MGVSVGTKVKIAFLFLIACQLISTSCSKQVYRETALPPIERRSEKKKLEVFFNAGIEKKIVTHNTRAEEIILTAHKYLGVPHCMGGTTMKCMDCSGLVATVFAKYGIILPHNSEEQARYGKIISGTDKLMKGDLVFFVRSYKTSNYITHSGIYTGNNKFIHASSKSGVTITSLSDPYWKQRFIFGTRLLD